MNKMNIKNKLRFETIDNRILYMVEHDLYLEYSELSHIYSNIAYKLKPNYTTLCQSILFLLDKFDGEKLESLIKVLNSDFEYRPNWKIDINTLEDRFSTWTYTCTNPETSKFLINLSKQVKHQIKNKNLEDLKQATMEYPTN